MNKGLKRISTLLIITSTIFTMLSMVGCKSNSKTSGNSSQDSAVQSSASNEVQEEEAAKKIKSFSDVKNYNIYYGYNFTDEIIESMEKYDVVVVEPLNIRDESILKRIKAKGVRVFGYLSFAEVSPYDNEMLSKVSDSEYLLIDGSRVQNFGCDIADIRQDKFKNTLMEVVKSRIVDGGYDGLFVDTLDDFEFTTLMKSEALVNEMTSEVAKLLKLLNTTFPDLSVILNRAFTGLDKCEGRYVDAVLFESMQPLKNDGYYENIVKKIDRFTAKGGVCLSLSNDPSQEKIGKTESKEKGWVYYYRPDQEYTKWHEYLN